MYPAPPVTSTGQVEEFNSRMALPVHEGESMRPLAAGASTRSAATIGRFARDVQSSCGGGDKVASGTA